MNWWSWVTSANSLICSCVTWNHSPAPSSFPISALNNSYALAAASLMGAPYESERRNGESRSQAIADIARRTRPGDTADLADQWRHAVELGGHDVLALQLVDGSHDRRHREPLGGAAMGAVPEGRDRHVVMQRPFRPASGFVRRPHVFAVRDR